jgi:hypothetical protein
MPCSSTCPSKKRLSFYSSRFTLSASTRLSCNSALVFDYGNLSALLIKSLNSISLLKFYTCSDRISSSFFYNSTVKYYICLVSSFMISAFSWTLGLSSSYAGVFEMSCCETISLLINSVSSYWSSFMVDLLTSNYWLASFSSFKWRFYFYFSYNSYCKWANC